MNNIHSSVAPSNARLWTTRSRRFSWLTKYRFIYICTISVLHMRSVDYIPWSPLTSLLARLVLVLNLPQQQTRRDSPRKNKQMRPIGGDELSCHTLITITSQRVQPVAITSHVPTPRSPLLTPLLYCRAIPNRKPLPIFGARVKAEKTLDTIKVL